MRLPGKGKAGCAVIGAEGIGPEGPPTTAGPRPA
ncbi:DUF6053 domain-containing protein [Lysobacter yananisis]